MQPTSRSMPGAASCTTTTSLRPSWTACSSGAGSSPSTGRPCGHDTFALTNPSHLRHQVNRPEFPELTGQSFRNPHHRGGITWLLSCDETSGEHCVQRRAGSVAVARPLHRSAALLSRRIPKQARCSEHGDDLRYAGTQPINDPIRPDDDLTKVVRVPLRHHPAGFRERLQPVNSRYEPL